MLARAANGFADPRDRGLLTDLVYGTLRHHILLDHALEPLLRHPERLPELVRHSLRAGAYELLIRGTSRHAAVNDWVEVVKAAQPRLSGLANAVLRRVEAPRDLAPWHSASLPQWLWKELAELLGEDALPAARGMLEPEPLWLSAVRPGAAESLLASGCEVKEGPVPGSLAVRSPVPLPQLPAFREGEVQPQNPASRLPVIALEARPGERVLDLAAGNGIKTAQLAAAGALVTAVEIGEEKSRRAQENLARLKLEAQHVAADLRSPPPLQPAGRVLLDAPCTGTGTLRGNPEIKLRLQPGDVGELAKLQSEMLDSAAVLVERGGQLVYSVCALTPQEGPRQIRSFLARHPEFTPVPVEGLIPEGVKVRRLEHGVVVLPCGGLDGFFIARLHRS